MIQSKKLSNNELGEHLPDSDAELYIQSEPIEAENRASAEEKCNEIAAEYGGVSPEVEKVGDNQFDCRFKLWY